MVKITGLDKLSKKMKELSVFAGDMDGRLGSVAYVPDDAASIDRAMHEIDALVDEHASHYPSNDLIQNIADRMKESYRSQLLEKAAARRLENEG